MPKIGGDEAKMIEFCKCLKVRRFFPNDHDLVVLGVVVHDYDSYFVFRTGAGREYTVSKNSEFSLFDTDVEFKNNGTKI